METELEYWVGEFGVGVFDERERIDSNFTFTTDRLEEG